MYLNLHNKIKLLTFCKHLTHISNKQYIFLYINWISEFVSKICNLFIALSLLYSYLTIVIYLNFRY